MPVYPFGANIVSGRQDQGTVVSNVLNLDPLYALPFALRIQPNLSFDGPLGLYQDTSFTIPATQDGDPVAAWRDELSGSGISVIQSDTQKQPMLVFEGGIPTVVFDGVDDVLSYDKPGGGAWLPQPCQYIVGVAVTGTTGGRRFISSRNTGTGRQLIYEQGGNYQIFAGANLSGGAGNEAWHIWSTQFNGANSTISIDDTLLATGDAGSQAQQAGVDVGAESVESQFAECSIAFVYAFTRLLTPEEEALVYSYVSTP